MNVDKPSSNIFKFYEIAGMMVAPGSKHPNLVRFNMGIFYVGLVYYWLAQFPTLFMDQFKDKFSTIQYIVSVVHVMYKHFMIMVLKDKILDFISFMDEKWENLQKNAQHKEIFEEYFTESIKPGNRFLYGCFTLNIITASLWMAFNYLTRSPDDWSIWIDCWGVVDPKKYFWTFFLLQFWTFQTTVISEGVSLPMVNYICSQVAGHMRVLTHIMNERKPASRSYYIESYKYHQDILKMVEKINTLYSHSYFVEMFLSSIQIAARSYGILVLINKYGIGSYLFGHLFLACLLIGAPYCICYSCQLIKEEAEGLYRSTYNNLWYTDDAKANKDLVIMASFASKQLIVNFKSFSYMSLEQFSAFAQATYSYIAMLKNVTF